MPPARSNRREGVGRGIGFSLGQNHAAISVRLSSQMFTTP